ncbi:Friend virus susceptibility protein 1-like [Ctenodactylus gundi]
MIQEVDPFDCPDSPLVRSDAFGDSIHKIFENFWKSGKCDDAGRLLFAALDKLMNSRAEVAEHQAHALIIRLAELQRQVNSQLRRVSEFKVRALIGKKLDPANWDGDVWEEQGESEEFIDPEYVILPEEETPLPAAAPPSAAEASPPLNEETHPVLPMETVGKLPARMTRQDNAGALQDMPEDPPLFSSRPISRVKSKKAPNGEVHSTTPEEVGYTSKELVELSNSYKQRSGEQVWEWILRVWDDGGGNIHLDQSEFLDMGPLSRDSGFNVIAHEVRKGTNSLFGWLAEAWIKRWPAVIDLEIPDIPWFTVEEGIQKLGGVGMLEWLCQMNSTHSDWEGPDQVPLTMSPRNRLVMGDRFCSPSPVLLQRIKNPNHLPKVAELIYG